MPDPNALPAGRILQLRGHRVILDADLARLYGTTTKRLNEQVRRNRRRFPEDFCFQATHAEAEALRSQVATSNTGRGGRRYAPFAFTEHGVLQAANVLHSHRAIEMSIYLVRAFVRMRETLAANAEILKRLAQIDRKLIEHDVTLQVLWKKLQPLLTPPPEPPKRRIGFIP